MKANKKTLIAVKKYLEEPEGYDRDEVIGELIYETKKLTIQGMKGLISPDECSINWGDDVICDLEEFVGDYTEKFIEKICNILDSFVGDDIDCYLEEDM